MLYLVAYDISSDRVRTRISTVLEVFGARVQGSVFEVRLPEARLGELQRALSLVLGNTTAGQVRVYPVCDACYRGAFGVGAIAEADLALGFLIV